jgi:hypothetical protein
MNQLQQRLGARKPDDPPRKTGVFGLKDGVVKLEVLDEGDRCGLEAANFAAVRARL